MALNASGYLIIYFDLYICINLLNLFYEIAGVL